MVDPTESKTGIVIVPDIYIYNTSVRSIERCHHIFLHLFVFVVHTAFPNHFFRRGLCNCLRKRLRRENMLQTIQ